LTFLYSTPPTCTLLIQSSKKTRRIQKNVTPPSQARALCPVN